MRIIEGISEKATLKDIQNEVQKETAREDRGIRRKNLKRSVNRQMAILRALEQNNF